MSLQQSITAMLGEENEVQPRQRGVLRRPPSAGAARKSLDGYLQGELAEGQGELEGVPGQDHRTLDDFEEQLEEQERLAAQAKEQGSKAQQLALQECPLRTRKINRKIRIGKPNFSRMIATPESTRSLARMPSSYRSRTQVDVTPKKAVLAVAAERCVHVAAGVAKAGIHEVEAVKATAIQVVDDVFGPEADAIADRITGKLIAATFPNLDDDDDDHGVRAAKHGVREEHMQAELRRQSTQSVKNLCGIHATDRKSEFEKLTAHGRYHCGAAEADLRITQTPGEEIDRTEGDEEDKEIETRVLLQRQKTELRELNLYQFEEEADKLTTKTQIRAETIEEVWLQSQSGALRRKPQQYEAVFDFQSGRVTIPRYLSGHTAGQLLDVQPNFNAPRTRGIVKVRALVPRRRCVATATHLEDVCDMKKMERQSLKLAEVRHGAKPGVGLQGQGHLHVHRKLPITTDMDEWNELQQIKRQRQDEEDEKLRQKETVHEQQAHDSDSESARSAGGESDALPEISWQGSRRVAVRGAIQMEGSKKSGPPWDVRPQPDGKDLKQFLQNIGLGHLKNNIEGGDAAEDGASGKLEKSKSRRRVQTPQTPQSPQTAEPADAADAAGAAITADAQTSTGRPDQRRERATPHVGFSEPNHGFNSVANGGVAGDAEQQGGRRLPSSCGWC